jgi:tRNA (mo5U34)-methyltransferase
MAGTPKKIAVAPKGFDFDSFCKDIFWYQTWELFAGQFTPGVNSIEAMCDDLHLPADLSGKTVLDIGAWNGCLSFECERRGASEVVAISPENPSQTGFNKVRDIIGSKRVRYVRGSVYDLNPRKLGMFDIVLFCGVLYHLRYPLLGIDNIRKICKGEVFVETHVCDDQFILRDGNRGLKSVNLRAMSPELLKTPVWQFYRRDELNNDESNWFGPNVEAVIQAFESAGFATRLISKKRRGMFHGVVKPGMPEFLGTTNVDGSCEDFVACHLQGIDANKSFVASKCSFQNQLLTTLLASDEYARRHGGTGPWWLASVHKDLLGDGQATTQATLPMHNLFAETIEYRKAVVERILASAEYRTKLITDSYKNYLGRTCSAADVDHWLGVLERGCAPEQLAAEFLGSDECYRQNGSADDLWLEKVSKTLLGQCSSSHDAHCESLARGSFSRSQVAMAIIESNEYRQHLIRETSIAMLGRSAARDEATVWLDGWSVAA